MSHDHSHVGDHALDRRLWATVAHNTVISVAVAIGGFLSGNLGLLSDAARRGGCAQP